MAKRKKPKPAKKEKPARIERRARVTFFLVAHVQEEVNAVEDVINYLNGQYWFFITTGEWELPVTGFTHSAVHEIALQKDPIFMGLWWSWTKIRIGGIEAPKLEQMTENVVLFVVDLPVVAEEWKFDEGIVRLKDQIFSVYARHGRPQEEIWVVKQDIYRYA